MKDLLCNSAFFGVVISILGYEIGLFLKKKFNNGIFNPLLISILFVMASLVIFKVDFESYNNGAKYLSYLLTPATVCLAIPLYEQLDLLKNNFKAIILGIFSGVAASLISVFLFALLFQFTHEQYVTLLPKSITTAIGMGISEELNGIVTITVAVIIVTGIIGNILAEVICKVFHIHEPIAKGIAIGTSSHAIGTAKAMEIGEIEGAMSGLAIAVAGLFTVIGASIFANLL
ncbi:membrane protein [Clostridium sulfidigenes]|uniref:Membrane protein n=1 Tax=Clostridium sulfidigenes TaxID=318464 RepID=A0A084JIQ8_9CLOT|nr:LrgB family protein [Clostridium sulfidigenes]KEZ88842.1 membrane protein [Clostridium sulfidigenes]